MESFTRVGSRIAFKYKTREKVNDYENYLGFVGNDCSKLDAVSCFDQGTLTKGEGSVQLTSLY